MSQPLISLMLYNRAAKETTEQQRIRQFQNKKSAHFSQVKE